MIESANSNLVDIVDSHQDSINKKIGIIQHQAFHLFDNNTLLPESQIKYEKISKTKYRVKIHNVKNKIFFIMNTRFDEGWEIEAESDNFKIKNSVHFVANMYANGWIADVNKSNDDEISIIVRYKPQKH